jgi:hypothetical protein
MVGVVILRIGGAWLPYWSDEEGVVLERDASRDYHMELLWKAVEQRKRRL